MAKVDSPGVPPSVLAFARRLSPRAQAALGAWRWAVDEAERLPREELRRRLADKGMIEWPFLWPLEEAFAGVEVRVGGFDLEFGAACGLPHYEREELVDDRGRVRFVPVGYFGIYSIFLDASGAMFLFHEPDHLVPIEPSFESFIEREAMSASLSTWAPRAFHARLSPKRIAEAIAAEHAVPAVPEASNAFHRWWQDGALTVFEPAGEGHAAIWTKTAEDLARALDSAARMDPALEARPSMDALEAHPEQVLADELDRRAPSTDELRARKGARRIGFLGSPSVYPGKPASTGEVWISGEGETLRIDVLERREGALVSYSSLRPDGGLRLVTSLQGRG